MAKASKKLKLKLEVGRKYYDADGDVVEIIGTGMLGRRKTYVCRYEKPDYRGIRLEVFSTGKNIEGLDDLPLVSEVESKPLVKKPKFKLRVGGYYLNRRGEVRGPLFGNNSEIYPFRTQDNESWASNGRTYFEDDSDSEDSFDLVQEVTVMPVVQKLNLEIGKSYRTRDGKNVVKIVCKSNFLKSGYEFQGDNHCVYGAHGEFSPNDEEVDEDLVEEVEAPPEPKTYYVTAEFEVTAESESLAREVVMSCIDASDIDDFGVEITEVVED